jgi:transposase
MEIRAGRRFRTKAERRQIVEETMEPGRSVSQVARAHDVNTNQVFQWRRLYREGWFDGEKKSAAMLPVRIAAAATRKTKASAQTATAGRIHIDLGHARVRIEGDANPDCVRAALEGLVR